MPLHNSSIVSAAGMLGVSVDELASWVEQVNPSKGKTPACRWKDLEEVESEVQKTLEAANPLLAQRYRMVSFVAARLYR